MLCLFFVSKQTNKMNVCLSQVTNLILIFSLWVCIMYVYLTNRFSQLDWCFYFILFFTLYFSTDRFHGTLLSMQFFCYVWFDFACLKQFGFSQWDVAKSCHMLFTVTQLQASRFCRNLMLQKIVKQQTIENSKSKHCRRLEPLCFEWNRWTQLNNHFTSK